MLICSQDKGDASRFLTYCLATVQGIARLLILGFTGG